ncbi:RICIN domain-containing protein [Actinoplanes sp. N902-109]|uniref:RICIN domain-containing protein n=1 Tax=Actinoplanes sp. (strain N902-109) TaxID=649831 RepID=UPI0003295F02|nr:RICIN domain-containing protein [Actinoplanes sp. N902-109]AGL18354.1 alpha-1,2-mannosidase [Actinoplanes sp. N902-109]
MTQHDDPAQGLDDGNPRLVRPYLQDGTRVEQSAPTWPATEEEPTGGVAERRRGGTAGDATAVLPVVGAPGKSGHGAGAASHPRGAGKNSTPGSGGTAAGTDAAVRRGSSGDDATVVLPVAGTPGRSGRRFSRLTVLAAGAGAVVVALAVAGVAIVLRPTDGGAPQGFQDVSLPPWSTATSAAPRRTRTTAPGDGGVPQPPPTVARQHAPSRPAASEASRTTEASRAPQASKAPAPAPSSAAPAADRTGVITLRFGVCLDLNGGVAVDDNHVQVFPCNGTAAQVWTLATDGTLRVDGKCARAGRDDAVRITTCGDRDDITWRVGGTSSLIHVATGQCLTDPAFGRQPGSGVRTDDCDGGRNQRWTLP